MRDYLELISRGMVYQLDTAALIALIPCKTEAEVKDVLKTVPKFPISALKADAA